jgi:hypothetical protein
MLTDLINVNLPKQPREEDVGLGVPPLLQIKTNYFNTTTDPAGAAIYPDDANIFPQWVQG